MKHSTSMSKTRLKNVAVKVFSCSQIIVLSVAIPLLYYTGITYNNVNNHKQHLIKTNKGKKMFATSEKINNKTVKYLSASLRLQKLI